LNHESYTFGSLETFPLMRTYCGDLEIIGFSNRHIYGGRIAVHSYGSGIGLNVKGEFLPDYLRPDKLKLFIDVESVESPEGRSRFNSLETEVVTCAS
jgi:hypothetical protein